MRTCELAYFSKHGKPIWSEPRGIEAGLQMAAILDPPRRAAADPARRRDRCGWARKTFAPAIILQDWTETADGVRADFIDKATGRPAGSHEGDTPDRRRRHPLAHPREALPAGRPADLERPHSLARDHRRDAFLTGRTMIMAGHEDPEIRLLSDLEGAGRVRQISDQLGRRAAHAADLPMAPRRL